MKSFALVVAILFLSGCVQGSPPSANGASSSQPLATAPIVPITSAHAPFLNNVSADDLYAKTLRVPLAPGQWSLFHIALDAAKYGEKEPFDGQAFFSYVARINGTGVAKVVELIQDASIFTGRIQPGILPTGRVLDLKEGTATFAGNRGLGLFGGDPADYTFPRYEFAWAIRVDTPAIFEFAVVKDFADKMPGRPTMAISPVAIGQALDVGTALYEWGAESSLVGSSLGALNLTDAGKGLHASDFDGLRTLQVKGIIQAPSKGFAFASGSVRATLAVDQWSYAVPGGSGMGTGLDGLELVQGEAGMERAQFSHLSPDANGQLAYQFTATLSGFGTTPAVASTPALRADWGYVSFDPYAFFGWPQN